VPHPIRFLPILTLCCALVLPSCGGGGGSQSFATCGNHRLDSGESCDDGNADDNDACTTACRPARCGDGVAYRSVEECDGRDMLNASCATFGLAGFLGCASDCTYDLSGCSAAPPTSTPLPPTPTATPSPTPRTDTCGDGLLSPGETCTSCPADCVPQTCGSGGGEANVTVSLAVPSAATQITFALTYRTNVVSLPAPPTGRVTSLSTPPLLLRGTNVGGYGINVASPPTANQASGPFARLRFDRCAGAPAPEMDDFVCNVTVCRSGGIDLTACTCVAAP
jgi:cysteine-rich repeat protein